MKNIQIEKLNLILTDGGVCGLVDSATIVYRVLVAGRIINNKLNYKN